MANNYTGEVIKYLRRKDSSGFEPVSWLGSEQRFVGALRNSALNNLEEQFAVGTDSYTVIYEDSEGNHVIEKSFCITDLDPSNPSGTDIEDRTEYYKVVTTIYKDAEEQGDYVFDGDKIIFSDRNNDVAFGDGDIYPDVDSLYCLDDETFEWYDEFLRIHPSNEFFNSRKDELYFIKKGEPDLLVLTKLTTKKLDPSGRMIVRKKIVNALNP